MTSDHGHPAIFYYSSTEFCLMNDFASDASIKTGWEISSRDRGVGISPEHIPKIFDPFFSTKERGRQKGVGLGLSTAYSIIRA